MTLTFPETLHGAGPDPEVYVRSIEVVMCERCGAVVAAPPGIPIHEAWHARLDRILASNTWAAECDEFGCHDDQFTGGPI